MKAATVHELKQELKDRSQDELVELCLGLAKFKKENKELLTYLLYESIDEISFISGVKEEMEEDFKRINDRNFYYIKKSVRKILRNVKKYIRYSKRKQTEVELLLHFCFLLSEMQPSFRRNLALANLYDRQVNTIKKCISQLHEDLQYDFNLELDSL
ncbi:MAG: hypothetical protein HKN45_08865 [Flavobacteriales bacterium]|nr:hypothetical protein [Flavobacteriales bacterium]